MKKLLFLLFAFFVLVANAQENNDSIQTIEMNRTFSVGGNAIMCLRSANANKKSLQALEWTLKNNHIGENNVIVLEVKNRNTGEQVAHQIWTDGAFARMKVKNGKPAMYEVYDDLFSHLRIVDVNLGFIVLFYSEMLKK